MERQEGDSVLNGNCEDSEEVSVNCFDGSSFCGKCCYETEMPLTEEDIARIEALGYSRSDFTVRDGSIVRLRNVNGKCFFLDSENRCKIYQYRPKGCRIYPAVFDGKDVIADRFCQNGERLRWKMSEEAFFS